MSIAALAGSMGGAALGYLGQRETNKSNEEMATNANTVSIQEAARNRNFQQEMSNTAHFREVQDLKRAGLNPLLSSMQTGASTPSGSAASGQVGNRMENSLGAGVSGAIEARRLAMEIAKNKADIGLTEKTGKLAEANARKSKAETSMIQSNQNEGDTRSSIWGQIKNAVSGFGKKLGEANQSDAKEYKLPSGRKVWMKNQK